ncbi:MAG: hypothetical protein JXB38_08070 [Anaerolineales bacterium]|nr:hypothetical protein [Anaerolineales bacterium]
MRKSFYLLTAIIALMLLAACSPQAGEATPVPSTETEAAPVATEAPPTEVAATPTTGPTATPIDIEANPELVDKSFITGEPCEAPCWYNLEVGGILEGDVALMLSFLPFIDRTTIQASADIYDPLSTIITYDCVYETAENCGFIGVSAAGEISGVAHQIVYPLSLADVVEKYAEPAYMYVNAYYGDEDNCQLAMYWPEHGIAVEVIEDSEAGLCQSVKTGESIPTNLQVLWVYYSPLPADGGEGTLPWPGFSE